MQSDGQDDAIFNYSNASLFTYELCYNYTDGMLLMRLPFASHFQHMQSNYSRSGQADRLCARGTHRCDPLYQGCSTAHCSQQDSL